MVEASNVVFDTWWQTCSNFYDELVRRKTISILLFSRYALACVRACRCACG